LDFELPKDAAFRRPHGAALGGRVVVVARDVKQAVDEVEGEFGGGRAAKLAGDDDGAFGADNDFTKAVAEVEADDIGGAGVMQKLLVDRGDGGVVHEGDAEFAKRQTVAAVSDRRLFVLCRISAVRDRRYSVGGYD